MVRMARLTGNEWEHARGTVVALDDNDLILDGPFHGYYAVLEEDDDWSAVLVDEVNHPAHYSDGMPEGIEVLDVIESQGWTDNYFLGNATKYLLRCEHKGNKKQDLEKAIFYLKREIERL